MLAGDKCQQGFFCAKSRGFDIGVGADSVQVDVDRPIKKVALGPLGDEGQDEVQTVPFYLAGVEVMLGGGARGHLFPVPHGPQASAVEYRLHHGVAAHA